MSQVRGIFPLFLVSALGIVNGELAYCLYVSICSTDWHNEGVWVFGPALKDQQREKEENGYQFTNRHGSLQCKSDEYLSRKKEELERLSEEGALKGRDAEAAASRIAMTTSALKNEAQSSSWGSRLGFWSQKATPTSSEIIHSAHEPKGKWI